MAEMGTMDEVIDAILNHVKQGAIKVYNQYRYDREKQAVLETWERTLQSVVTGKGAGKIVSISTAKGNTKRLFVNNVTTDRARNVYLRTSSKAAV
jgi:hypothetical protein